MFKKTLLISAISLFISCSDTEVLNDENLVQTKPNQEKLDFALKQFKGAIIEMNQPKYHPTKEYTLKHGDELSDERKEILLAPAIELIYANGVTEQELMKETGGDKNLILKKGFKIFSKEFKK